MRRRLLVLRRRQPVLRRLLGPGGDRVRPRQLWRQRVQGAPAGRVHSQLPGQRCVLGRHEDYCEELLDWLCGPCCGGFPRKLPPALLIRPDGGEPHEEAPAAVFCGDPAAKHRILRPFGKQHGGPLGQAGQGRVVRGGCCWHHPWALYPEPLHHGYFARDCLLEGLDAHPDLLCHLPSHGRRQLLPDAVHRWGWRRQQQELPERGGGRQ
mmetsp:Transcript_21861/g.50756  ORF Transcript_21861/g.50756 Transcript_21861/m.50756 type:complete len:209 (+) Transcript_21861:2540-3166(+)